MRRIFGICVPVLLVLASCGGGGSGPGSAGSVANWCDLVTELDATDDALDFAMFNPDSMKDTFEDLGRLLSRATAAAPSEIKADLETTQRAFGQFAGALAAVDYNLMALDESLFEFDTDLEAASDRIDAYNQRVCGTEPTEDASGSSGGLGTDAEVDFDELLGGIDEMIEDEDLSALLGENAEQLAEMFGDQGGLAAMYAEQLAVIFESQGFTSAEARCLAAQLDVEAFIGGAVDFTDPNTIMGSFENCGISASRMAELDG